MEVSFNIVFLAIIWLMLPSLGLQATAIALLIGYFIYFVITNILAYTLQGFRWKALSIGLVGMHIILALILLGLALVFPLSAAIVSLFMTAVTGLYGIRVVLKKIGPNGRVGINLVKFYTFIRWPI
jgi:PST family polysaccharide transporter